MVKVCIMLVNDIIVNIRQECCVMFFQRKELTCGCCLEVCCGCE